MGSLPFEIMGIESACAHEVVDDQRVRMREVLNTPYILNVIQIKKMLTRYMM